MEVPKLSKMSVTDYVRYYRPIAAKKLSKERLVLSIARWIEEHLGETDFRTKRPGAPKQYAPGSQARLKFGRRSDGSERYTFWVAGDGEGYNIEHPQRGNLVYGSPEEARRLAVYILWDWWIVSTWMGLKSELWFWAIGVKVRRLLRAQEQKAGRLRGTKL